MTNFDAVGTESTPNEPSNDPAERHADAEKDTKSTGRIAVASNEPSLDRRGLLAAIAGALGATVAGCALDGRGSIEALDDGGGIGQIALGLSGAGTVYFADTAAELRALAGGSVGWVSVLAGYHARGDGGGGIFYWDSASAQDDGGTALNAGAANSAGWRRIRDGRLSVRAFGAKGDGVADDTVAVQATLDAIPATGGAVYFPAGTYRVSAQFLVQNKAISLIGEGMFVSKLRWILASASSGFLFEQDDDDYTISIQALTLLTEQAAVGTAISIDMSLQESNGVVQDRGQPRVVIRDVAVEGATNVTTDAFSIGLHAIDVIHLVIDGFHFQGKRDPVVATTVNSLYAMRLETSHKAVEAILKNCWAFHASTALGIVAYEGVLLQNYNFVAVTKGVEFTTTSGGPQINVLDGHINAYSRCVRISGASQGQIRGNLFYLNSAATANGAGVVLDNAQWYNISDNTFVKIASPVNYDAIVFTNATHHCRVGPNLFQQVSTAVWFQGDTYENRIDRQLYGSVTNYKILDQGTENLRASASALVRRTSNQAIASSATTTVSFDGILRDDAGWHSSASNTRLTVPPGVERVVVSAGIVWGNNSTGQRIARIKKNGALFYGSASSRVQAASNTTQNITTGALEVSAGDYFEVEVFQNSGASLDILSVTETWFAIMAVE